MNRQLFSIVLGLSGFTGALSQSPTSSSVPLNIWLDTANSAIAAVNSAVAKQTASKSSSSSSASSTSSSSTTSPIAAPATASPSSTGAPSHSSSHKNLIITIVVVVVGILLLLGLLLGICCCLTRRRKRRRSRNASPDEEEIKTWGTPQARNPGRDYSPIDQHGHGPMTQTVTAPLMSGANNAPDINQHPALRHENPFVPVPPSPRKAPNSRAGLTDGTVPGAEPFIGAAAAKESNRRLSKSGSRSRSSSFTRLPKSPVAATEREPLPTHNTNSRPPTPFGLSGIGQPYEDMHVHTLQSEQPSDELKQSLATREPIQRYSTPPEVPSRSPHRSGNYSTENSYSTTDSGGETTTNSSGEYIQPPTGHYPLVPPYDHAHQKENQNRFSASSAVPQSTNPWTSPSADSHPYNNPNSNFGRHSLQHPMPPPAIPWENQPRRHSPTHSPHPSHNGFQFTDPEAATGRRRSSRSPATSINGQPRRLRFSDLQARDDGGWEAQGMDGSRGHQPGMQGVGEAL